MPVVDRHEGGQAFKRIRVSGALDPAPAAEGSSEPGVPIRFIIPVANTTVANTDITAKKKVRVTDVTVIKTGGDNTTTNGGVATATIKLASTGGDITDAMEFDIVDQTIKRATKLNDANHVIAAGNIIRVTRANLSTATANHAAIVYVDAIRAT
jgi:hypothetical protein